jgi:hypothetical protein
VTQLDRVPTVNSTPVGALAQWTFHRTPTTPLVGGFAVLATALVPRSLERITLDVSAIVQFQDWEPQVRSIRKEMAIPRP